MRKELDHYIIDGEYGSNQDKFKDFWMNKGGCAAICACESAIFFEKYKGLGGLCPIQVADEMSHEDFEEFGMIMKPYLKPRITGIDILDVYTEGFLSYLSGRNCHSVKITEIHGDRPVEEAKELFIKKIDEGFFVPYLLLHHKDKDFHEFEWHWFLLNGYSDAASLTKDDYLTDVMRPQGECDHLFVKSATYGEAEWLDFDRMWETGVTKRGGMILYDIEE